jgi:hypothetical protein
MFTHLNNFTHAACSKLIMPHLIFFRFDYEYTSYSKQWWGYLIMYLISYLNKNMNIQCVLNVLHVCIRYNLIAVQLASHPWGCSQMFCLGRLHYNLQRHTVKSILTTNLNLWIITLMPQCFNEKHSTVTSVKHSQTRRLCQTS